MLQLPCTETEVPSNMESRTRQQPSHNNGGGFVQEAKKVTEQSRKQTSVLPDELILKIIARMGFPSVFKARLLSRAWYFRFPLPSKPIRCLSMSLQNEILSVSSKWTSYSPVYFGKGEILGFDRAFGGWKRFSLSLSYLPVEDWSSVDFLTSAGSIMCAITSGDDDVIRDSRVFVTNVLNETWTELHLSHEHVAENQAMWPDYARIFPVGFDSYQVLLLFKSRATKSVHGELDLGSCIVSHLYDSNLRTWSSIMSEPMEPTIGRFYFNSAYLNGKLYCLSSGEDTDDYTWQLWVHLITDFHHFTDSNTNSDPVNAWIAIPHPLTAQEVVEGGVFLCGDNVMVVIWGPETSRQGEEREALAKRSHKFYTSRNTIRIFQLDVNSLQLVEVCKGPPRTMFGVGLMDKECIVGIWNDRINFSSDDDYIYFGQTIPGIPMMTYNVRNHKWSFLPPPCYTLDSIFDEFTSMEQCPFTPGVNPFAIVS